MEKTEEDIENDIGKDIENDIENEDDEKEYEEERENNGHSSSVNGHSSKEPNVKLGMTHVEEKEIGDDEQCEEIDNSDGEERRRRATEKGDGEGRRRKVTSDDNGVHQWNFLMRERIEKMKVMKVME